jgi:hypothetical protein
LAFNGPLGIISQKTELFNIELDLKEIVYEGGLDSSCSGQGSMLSACDHGNEPFSFTKDGEFIDQLHNYHLIKKDSGS